MMRRIALLSAALLLAATPHLTAQHAHGGFILAGRGGGGTPLLDNRASLDMAYTLEVGERNGPYVGGRSVLGIHWFDADEEGFRDRYGDGEVRGGGGTLYDTGVDLEIGYGIGVVRVYTFVGMHYYQQYHNPAVFETGSDEIELVVRRQETINVAHGYGVHLRLTNDGAVVAETYRGGGKDGVMRLSGTRFGLRWAWW